MSSSKAKNKNANSEEDQLTLKDLLGRLEALNAETNLKIDDKFNIVGEKFVVFKKIHEPRRGLC